MFIIQICDGSYEMHEGKNMKTRYFQIKWDIASLDQLKSKDVTATLFFHRFNHVTIISSGVVGRR